MHVPRLNEALTYNKTWPTRQISEHEIINCSGGVYINSAILYTFTFHGIQRSTRFDSVLSPDWSMSSYNRNSIPQYFDVQRGGVKRFTAILSYIKNSHLVQVIKTIFVLFKRVSAYFI